MNKIHIAVTGYYGTGSSAVIDLLKEYNDVAIVPKTITDYEHVQFYIKDGLFDLVESLSTANNPIKSDTAINRFIESMTQLNNSRYIWMGNYKKYVGNDFLTISNRLVEKIATPFRGSNLNHCIGTRFSIYRMVLQLGAKILFGNRIQELGYITRFDKLPSWISLPTNDELYDAVRAYTQDYFSIMSKNSRASVCVYDHLLLPQHIGPFGNCFDDSFKIIVVLRDARDIYLINKYIYSQPIYKGFLGKMFAKREPPYFPTTPKEFIDIWERIVVPTERFPNCLTIYFEDLIYNYEETVSRIQNFCGLSDSAHAFPSRFLNINKSIENTQLFNVNNEWNKEVCLFEKKWLYDFPYRRLPDINKMMKS